LLPTRPTALSGSVGDGLDGVEIDEARRGDADGGELAGQWAVRYVPESAMRDRLNPIVRAWRPLDRGHDTARRVVVDLDSAAKRRSA